MMWLAPLVAATAWFAGEDFGTQGAVATALGDEAVAAPWATSRFGA